MSFNPLPLRANAAAAAASRHLSSAGTALVRPSARPHLRRFCFASCARGIGPSASLSLPPRPLPRAAFRSSRRRGFSTANDDVPPLDNEEITAAATCEDSPPENSERLYLHVSPSGDWWTGSELFAAKHLQPDYVRSVLLPDGIDEDELEVWLDGLGDEAEQMVVLRGVYDGGRLPDGGLLGRLSEDEVIE